MTRTYDIAVIPGDGIGKEVVPEGVRVLETAAKKFGFELKQTWHDFASYDYYAKHERMMPEDWQERLRDKRAIYFGAVGWPEKIPDHVSLWGSLILFRRNFDNTSICARFASCPASLRRLPTASPATSTSMSCARTRRANIRRSAGACFRIPSASSSCRRRS